MPSEQPTRPAPALNCQCGFFTSHPDYMLLHLAEGNCVPSDGQCNLMRNRVAAIHTELVAVGVQQSRLQNEQMRLSMILQMAVTPLVARRANARHCRQCGKLTVDKFGDAPQCERHTVVSTLPARVRSNVVSILDKLLNEG